MVPFGRSESTRRLGWLLRVNRGPRGLREFASVMNGALAPSTLSRWERGGTEVSHFAVQSYADTLDRPGLLAVADNMARYYGNRLGASPALPRPVLDPAEVSGRIDCLVDRAVGEDLFPGQDWDTLTDLLSRGLVVLSPRSTWEKLAERLLTELAIADGVNWLWRAEALHRLLAHPIGGRIVVATAATAAADPAAQSLVGAVSVLDATSSSHAASVVLRHLANPTSRRTFSGALLSCHRKVRLGHFTPGQLLRVGGTLADVRDQPLVAAIAASFPLPLRNRFGFTKPGCRDRRFGPAEAASMVQATIAAADDVLLPTLVTEALCSDVFDERMHALFLIKASPYRKTIARELGRAVVGRHHAPDSVAVTEALRCLGGHRERKLVERLVLAADTKPEVREAAAFTLGHVGGTSDQAFWSAALTAAQRWPSGSMATAALDRLVYAAGRVDERRFLHQVSVTPRLPGAVRVSARWWLEIPSHIRLSVTV